MLRTTGPLHRPLDWLAVQLVYVPYMSFLKNRRPARINPTAFWRVFPASRLKPSPEHPSTRAPEHPRARALLAANQPASLRRSPGETRTPGRCWPPAALPLLSSYPARLDYHNCNVAGSTVTAILSCSTPALVTATSSPACSPWSTITWRSFFNPRVTTRRSTVPFLTTKT